LQDPREVKVMIGRLLKYGDALALIIDPELLELLGIDAETALEVTTDGAVLIVSPIRDENRRERFREALLTANERYHDMLERLSE
jgi:antitoxin MazE